MEMVGHCLVAERSGRFTEDDVYGAGTVDLMLLNVIHAHDWAYRHAWTTAAFPPPLHAAVERIRAHLIADWIVHFGSMTTRTKSRCGWAYRRMQQAQARAVALFEDAEAQALVLDHARHPATWQPKQWRDFAHSMTEFSLDLMFEHNLMVGGRLAAVRAALWPLRDWDGKAGQRALLERGAALGSFSDRPQSYLVASMRALAEDADAAQRGCDFAVAMTVRKYGFRRGPRSESLIRNFLQQIVATLDPREVEGLLAQIAAAIRTPATLCDGPWSGVACDAD